MPRLAAGEGDRAALRHRHVDPERPGGVRPAEVKAPRRCVERLQPERDAGAVVAAHQKRPSVRHPDGPVEAAVEGAGDDLRLAARRGDDGDLVDVVHVAVPRIPEGDARAVGAEARVALQVLAPGQRTQGTRGHIEDLNRRLIGVAEVRLVLPCEGDPAAVGRPGEGRRRRPGRRAHGQAPATEGEPPRRPAFRRDQPDVRGQGRPLRQVVVVADLETVLALLHGLAVLRHVLGDEGECAAVRPPGELLHAGPGVGDLQRVAAVHWHDENLPMTLLVRRDRRGPLREERQSFPARRPARLGQLQPATRQDTLPAGHHVHQNEFRLVPVVVVIGSRYDDDDRFPVGGNLRVADPHQAGQVFETDTV